jgi:hypothetical protein
MRFERGDMRDHIVSHKSDHGASYRRYGVLPWRSRLKINFCEIFGVVRFSTFATLSPGERTSSGYLGMSEKCHVWTAPAVQEESDISAKRSGAAMYPAFECSRYGRWP